MRLEAILMSLSAALHAVKQGSRNATEVVVVAVVAMAIAPSGKCSPQYVPSVAKTLKCHLSLAREDQCIVAIVTIGPESADRGTSCF